MSNLLIEAEAPLLNNLSIAARQSRIRNTSSAITALRPVVNPHINRDGLSDRTYRIFQEIPLGVDQVATLLQALERANTTGLTTLVDIFSYIEDVQDLRRSIIRLFEEKLGPTKLAQLITSSDKLSVVNRDYIITHLLDRVLSGLLLEEATSIFNKVPDLLHNDITSQLEQEENKPNEEKNLDLLVERLVETILDRIRTERYQIPDDMEETLILPSNYSPEDNWTKSRGVAVTAITNDGSFSSFKILDGDAKIYPVEGSLQATDIVKVIPNSGKPQTITIVATSNLNPKLSVVRRVKVVEQTTTTS